MTKTPLWDRLRQARIVRMLAVYLAASWAILQVTALFVEQFGVPRWFMPVALVLLAIGLVVLLATAWVQSNPITTAREKLDEVPSDWELELKDAGRALARGKLPHLNWARAAFGGGVAFLLLFGFGGLYVLIQDRGRSLTPGDAAAEAEGPSDEAALAKSIAVLPFDNLSADPENEYLAAGLQDEILTQLAQVGDLRVISRTSVMEYGEGTRNLREIGQALGVGVVLEGSVQRQGDRVRVTAQLVDARTDAHLWAERYDRDLTDVFAIQSEIAQAIVQALAAELTAGERERLADRSTESAEAYDFYLRAREYRIPPTVTNLQAATGLYEEAVRADPAFALARAQLSMVHSLRYWFRHDFTAGRIAAARSEAEEALRLAPDLPQAHLAMGYVHYYGSRDYEAALEELEVALEGLPNDAQVVAAIAFVNRRLGRWEEHVAGLRRALELDPRNSDYLRNLAQSLHTLRRYQEAEPYFVRAEQLGPDDPTTALEKGMLFFHWRGTTDSLRASLERTATMPDPIGYRLLVVFDLALLERRFPEGLRVVETGPDPMRDQRRTYPKSLMRGWLYRLMGDPRAAAELERARPILERAVREAPEDYTLHLALGRAYALLGRRADAAREARRAMELLPASRDAMEGPEIAWEAAALLVQAGEGEEAIRILESVLEKPSAFNVNDLRRHPDWDPLRDDPRFQALLRSR